MSENYQHVLRSLLPRGKVWEWITQPGSYVWDTLMASLSAEPQRVEDDAYALLDQIIPDNADTDLDSWERIVGVPEETLTDQERLDRIRAILFGPPDVNLSDLQDAIRLMAGDPAATLFHRAYHPAAVGDCNVGDSLASGEWDFTWLCEYGTAMLDSSANDFEDWFGLVGAANGAEQSPVTLDTDAATATIPAFPTLGFTTMSNTAGVDAVRFSVWIYPDSDPCLPIRVHALGRDNVTVANVDFVLQPFTWHKLVYGIVLGEGATVPRVNLSAVGGSQDVFLAHATCAEHDAALETRIRTLFPIHTRGTFAALNEFAPLLAQTPNEVSF